MTLSARQMEISAALDRHEDAAYGLRRLGEHKCMAKLLPPRSGTCSELATYITADGQELCRTHAVRWADKQ